MIAVWFSCGAASAVAARLAIDEYGPSVVRVVNCPVKEEHEDNLRFMRDVQSWLGVDIETAINPKFPSNSAVDVWDKRRFMAGPHGAPCTVELKKEARYAWEKKHNPDWHVLGFTVDERDRHDRFVRTERDNVIPILIRAGLRKRDCVALLREAGLRPPAIYELGFPNANCIGCVKATSPAYWRLVQTHFPETFKHRAEQSRRLGARIVRVSGERMFLDEMPLADDSQIEMSFECGVFCEEVVQ